MIHPFILLLLCLYVLIGSPISVFSEVIVKDNHEVIHLESESVRIHFDLEKGTYELGSSGNDTQKFSDVFYSVDGIQSDQKELRHEWQCHDFTDELGEGKKLMVESSGSGDLNLLFEARVYDKYPGIVLGVGARNVSSASRIIQTLAPFIAPKTDLGNLDDLRVLNGVSGAGLSNVFHRNLAIESPNNLFVTGKKEGKRQSITVGGLTYNEFAKYCSLGGKYNRERRKRELNQSLGDAGRVVSYMDCGAWTMSPDETPCLHAKTFHQWDFPTDVLPPNHTSVLYDMKNVVIKGVRLNPQKKYAIGLSWWDYDNNGRVQSVKISNRDLTVDEYLIEKQDLPDYVQSKQLPDEMVFLIPPDTYAAKGQFNLVVKPETPGTNAVLGEAWLIELADGSTFQGYTPKQIQPETADQESLNQLCMWAYDPVGKRVDSQSAYMPNDLFYIDFVTSNPFENLEKYGLALRQANHAQPNIYDFPTVCLWYAMFHHYGNGPAVNSTKGAVEEVERAAQAGFLKYSPVAVRLVPDYYGTNNQQGWLDEKHWQMYGWQEYMFEKKEDYYEEKHFAEPFETASKWGKAMSDRGGIPFIYVQSGNLSKDYMDAFPDHMLFNGNMALAEELNGGPVPASYDFTDPGFQKHFTESWNYLRDGGVRGVMFDYPDTAWRDTGGFEDPYATTASAYRTMFRLAKEGLGPDSYIHERNVGPPPYLDMTVGVVDSQRVWGDTDLTNPDMYTRCGLRWYKARVIYSYDMDAKSMIKTNPRNRDGLRQMLSMVYVTAGRLLLGTSFGRFTPEMVYDLGRIYPQHKPPQSFRPIDAFNRDENQRYPQKYAFQVNPDWYQLALFNCDASREIQMEVDLGLETAEGGLGFEKESQYYLYDFWNDRFAGTFQGSEKISESLRPGEVRILSVHKALNHPQFISTNRHLMQGYLDLKEVTWDEKDKRLEGTASVIAGEPFEIVVAHNGNKVKNVHVDNGRCWLKHPQVTDDIHKLVLYSDCNTETKWGIQYE